MTLTDKGHPPGVQTKNRWPGPGSAAVLGLATAGCILAASAWAQNAPIQETPLPPLQRQWQQEGSPPVQQAPVLPNDTGPASPEQTVPGTALQDQGQAASPVAPPAVVERPSIWIPAGVAKLQALDKVNAQASDLTIKVGQSATFGSLTIKVTSCMVRPSDQPADAAVYLDVTDSHPDSPGFDGWMLEDEPSVSMLQHPIYDLRVTGCA
jgi:hypothetical protein